MERVSFLVESTGDRLSCLLNPESVIMRRWAGVRSRRSIGGVARRAGLMDDPLLFTGGGVTELNLDLLFDVALGGSTIPATDVRMLTGPFWQLAENADVVDGYGRPPLVRFLWGKAWNIPAVVAAAAERLERFDAGGAPRRSWMRLRLLRVAEPAAPAELSPAGPLPEGGERENGAAQPEVLISGPDRERGAAAPEGEVVELRGQRLDELAARHYGDPSLWRIIAKANGLSDPVHIAPGTVLRLPRVPRSVV